MKKFAFIVGIVLVPTKNHGPVDMFHRTMV